MHVVAWESKKRGFCKNCARCLGKYYILVLFVWGIKHGICVKMWMLYRVNIFCSIAAPYFEGLFWNYRRKWTQDLQTEAPYLLLTVSLEQIFHINTKKAKRLHLLPNCPLRWEVCSPLFRSLSFEFSYHLAPHPFCFSCWFTACQRQLTLTVWPQQRIIKGSIKGLPQARRIHREELPVQSPLMSHTGLGSEGLGTMPRLDQRSQFKLRERAKRITGNCISKGPSKKCSRKKKKESQKENNCILKAQDQK